MVDVHNNQQRSKNMAAIKGKGNKSTEQNFLLFLKEQKITGWRRHYKYVEGKPDFVFLKFKLAIFLDGCFWHGCPECYKPPRTNEAFWRNKMSINKQRDELVTQRLRNKGWKVLRIWEHNLKKESINTALGNQILELLEKP